MASYRDIGAYQGTAGSDNDIGAYQAAEAGAPAGTILPQITTAYMIIFIMIFMVYFSLET